ncbi:uncharacterized protein LOC134813899 [Bolinopsis microptera]|uniref:uncharacterized protein LOC134813899 n=1 Tax=Bolinopsis microptera TaxID=2820187 RepID=UPI00307A6F77
MEGLIAMETIRNLKTAMLTLAQLTEDGLTFLIGLSARLHAEEDLKVEAKVVPTLLQKMEGLIAMETIRNLKTATLTLAPLTEDGLTFLIGLSARLHAEEDLKVEAKVVPTLLQKMEGLIAMETIRNLKTAMLTLAQLTEDGLTFLIGLSARLHAEEDLKVEAKVVPTLLQKMEGLIAMEMIRNLKTATLTLAPLTEDGLTFLIGLSARLHAEEDLKVEAKVVPTLLQKMEGLIAMEMIRNLKTATLTLAQLTEVGLNSGNGLSALLHAEEDLKVEVEVVPTLLQKKEGLIAMETIRNLKPATLTLAFGETTINVVRRSPSRMALPVSVTLTTH